MPTLLESTPKLPTAAIMTRALRGRRSIRRGRNATSEIVGTRSDAPRTSRGLGRHLRLGRDLGLGLGLRLGLRLRARAALRGLHLDALALDDLVLRLRLLDGAERQLLRLLLDRGVVADDRVTGGLDRSVRHRE